MSKLKQILEIKKRLDPKCWDGYKKQGTKKKGDTVVNNCVKETESLGVMIARMQQKQTAKDWNKLTPAEKTAKLKKDMEDTKKRMAEGKNHTWKSEGHYTKDGKEWKGPQHAHDGQVMTGEKHNADSQNLYHFKELSPEVKKKVLEKIKMDEGIVDTILKSKTLNKKNYTIAAKELDKKMKKEPSKTKVAHAHDVARYVKNIDARKLAAENADRIAMIKAAVKKREAEKRKAAAEKPAEKEKPTRHLKNMQKKERENIDYYKKHTPGKKLNPMHNIGRHDGQKAQKNASKSYANPRTAAYLARHDYAEVEMTGCPLLEKLSPNMGIGKYIRDFGKSDAPQFKGASASKRRKMAVAAYLGAKRKNEKI